MWSGCVVVFASLRKRCVESPAQGSALQLAGDQGDSVAVVTSEANEGKASSYYGEQESTNRICPVRAWPPVDATSDFVAHQRPAAPSPLAGTSAESDATLKAGLPRTSLPRLRP